MYRLVMVWVLLLVCGVGAQAQEVSTGQALYRDHCSTCHGLVAPEGADRQRQLPLRRVAMLPSVTDGGRVAIAPPYGPPLRGVYGRPAGTVQGFTYSRAFKKVLQGVVWDRQTLDRWITDSQAWVPGSLMFYAQPDSEIRHQIITYLQASH
jgi:cytochrome c2